MPLIPYDRRSVDLMRAAADGTLTDEDRAELASRADALEAAAQLAQLDADDERRKREAEAARERREHLTRAAALVTGTKKRGRR